MRARVSRNVGGERKKEGEKKKLSGNERYTVITSHTQLRAGSTLLPATAAKLQQQHLGNRDLDIGRRRGGGGGGGGGKSILAGV